MLVGKFQKTRAAAARLAALFLAHPAPLKDFRLSWLFHSQIYKWTIDKWTTDTTIALFYKGCNASSAQIIVRETNMAKKTLKKSKKIQPTKPLMGTDFK
jgi:hypothetical protein